ncbi:MAG TPA: hypothetical protein VGN86_01605 [Pyrinomonadaceae bacterium]|nr:hypothetical protein [Pyrinomonadaceae bacterium]
MMRLHPVPMRYMDTEHRFHAFQRITARVQKHDTDPRPESYRIDPNSIQVGEIITNHNLRRSYIENSPHLIQSVEALKDKQHVDGTSLGIVSPKDILDCWIEKRPASEKVEWEANEKIRMAQQNLFGEKVKPLDFPEVKFMVQWTCDDQSCQGHSMGLLQWGINELYRKYKADPDCDEKVIEAMQKRLNQWERDVFMFLGNFRGIQYNFGLMDTYSAPAKIETSPSLFT